MFALSPVAKDVVYPNPLQFYKIPCALGGNM